MSKKDMGFQKCLNLRRSLGITEPFTEDEIRRLKILSGLALAFCALRVMINERDAGKWDG